MVLNPKIIFSAFFLIFISIFLSSQTIDITILFTGDSSGHPLQFDYMQQKGVGGFGARSTIFKRITGDKSNENILILDTGGIVNGRAESNLFNGLPDIEGMNILKYDATGIGFAEINRDKDYFDSLNSSADFYFLCANLKTLNKQQQETDITDEYYIKKFGGLKGIKVAVFSVISDEAINYLSEDGKKEFVIKNPIDKAKEIVNTLKNKEKADIIIALTYMGYYPDKSKFGSQTLAEEVSGIDLIIDGRTGYKFNKPVEINNTRIFQTSKLGLHVGEIKLKYENKQIIQVDFKQNPVNYMDTEDEVEIIDEDPKTVNLVKKKMRNLDKLLDRQLTVLKNNNLDSRGIREGETSMGNMICDAIVEHFGIDIAFQHAGGIAEALINPDNAVNRKTFNEVIKYDNSIYISIMSGKKIKELLRFSLARKGYGPFLQVGGLSFTYTESTNTILDIKVNGEVIEDEHLYSVAFNSWIAEGGDGYQILKNHIDKDDMNITLREVVYEYLSKRDEYSPVLDRRINIIE